MKDNLVNESGDLVKDLVNDTISRTAALTALGEEPPVWYDGEDEIAERDQWRRDVAAIKALPSAQPETHEKRTETHACDCISRQVAIDALTKDKKALEHIINGMSGYEKEFDRLVEQHNQVDYDIHAIEQLPFAQPNLSEAYSKAVFAWLMDYQIRAVELKGRYTPYEVLSWVINDWRKENG